MNTTLGHASSNISFTSQNSNLCNPVQTYGSLSFTILPIVEIAINVICIVSAYRSELRKSYVGIYLISTLTANVLFGIFSAYQLINQVFIFERIWNSNQPFILDNPGYSTTALKQWWSFRSGFVISLFLIMSGNISALIYGLRESSYFIGRSTCHVAHRENFEKSSRRGFTIITVLVTWILPIALSLASASGWSCVNHCLCVSSFYGDDIFYCQTDIYRQCSRFMQPQRYDFLVVTVLVWFLETIGMIVMITTTIKKYFAIIAAPPADASTAARIMKNTVAKSQPEKDGEGKTCLTRSIRDEQKSENKQYRSGSSCFLGWKNISNLNNSIKQLIIISVSFILCTLPTMVVIIIDMISDVYILNFVIVATCYLLTVGYCIISPVVMTYYMQKLQEGLKKTLLSCTCCTTVVVNSRTADGEVH